MGFEKTYRNFKEPERLQRRSFIETDVKNVENTLDFRVEAHVRKLSKLSNYCICQQTRIYWLEEGYLFK